MKTAFCAAALLALLAAPAFAQSPPAPGPDQVKAGAAVFAGNTCAACHGPEGKGTAIGPDLTTGTWLWGDGSLATIKDTIAKGVPAPKNSRSPMPPMGGAPLTPEDLDAVTAYVWSLGHK